MGARLRVGLGNRMVRIPNYESEVGGVVVVVGGPRIFMFSATWTHPVSIGIHRCIIFSYDGHKAKHRAVARPMFYVSYTLYSGIDYYSPNYK